MVTTTNLIELVRRLRLDPKNWVDAEAADLLEAQALDLDIQAGSIEAVQAANNRLSAQIEAQAKQIEALQAVENAALHLVKAKGRYHTEPNYKALETALAARKGNV